MPPRDVYMAKLFKPEISTGHPTHYHSQEITSMYKAISIGAKVVSVTNRGEKHGKELVAAQTMRLSYIIGGAHLDELDKSGSLRKSLFKKPSSKKAPSSESDTAVQTDLPMNDNGELIEIKLKKVPSVPYKEKLPGYTLQMGSGLTATQPVVQYSCTLDAFTLTPLDGGSVQIDHNVHFAVDEEHAGFFACQVQRLVNIWLLPPGHEDEEAELELADTAE